MIVRRSVTGSTSWVVALLILARPAPLSGQQSTSAPATGEQIGIIEQQRVIRDRVARLEDRMFQLSQALRKSDPEKGAQLMQSLGAARGMLLRQRMEEIAKNLEQSKLADATDQQKEVSADLQTLLRLLLEGPDKLDERKQEIKRLEAMQKQLEAVIARQQEAKRNADAAAGKGDDSLLEKIEQIGKLIQRQQDLSSRTAKAGEMRALAEEQGALRQEADEVAEQLQSGESSGASGPTPESAQSAEALSQAAGQMDAAQERMAEGSPQQAGGHQKQAEEQLARAMELLQKKAKDDAAARKANAPLEKQSGEQKEITQATKQLGKKMQGAGAGQPGDPESPQGGQPGEGEQQEGDEGESKGEKSQGGQSGEKKEEQGESGESGNEAPTPGGEQVQEAVPFQEEAEQQLDKQDPSKAAKSQEKALEKLEQAKEELKKTLEQLRKEQQEELLAALENRLRSMLAKQLEVNKSTIRLDELGAANWRRADELQLPELSQKQAWVGDEADKALYILKEEGTTVIFPQVIENLRDDAREVAERLTSAATGSAVQSVQESIAQTLRELIEAVEKKQQENESESGEGQGDSQEQDEPLLPPSAELKLLRSLQVRVNEATLQLEKDRAANPDQTDEMEARRQKLVDRQQQVQEMAKSMHEALRKAQ